MADYGRSITVTFTAYDATNSVWKTADSGNFSMRVVKDGVSAAATNAASSVDDTNDPGVYKLTLTAAEMSADVVTLCGKSSTGTSIIISPVVMITKASDVIHRGTAQSIPDSTHIQIAASATFANNEIVGATVEIISATTGTGQSRLITAYDSSTNTATIDPAWTTSPTGTVVCAIFATAPAPTTNPPSVVLAGAAGPKKNTAIANFEFKMTDSTTHAEKTGLAVTATRSIDGGAYAACANAVSELANGTYKINLAASDLNGLVIALRFTAAAADVTNIIFVTGN